VKTCGQTKALILAPILLAFSLVSMGAFGERTPKYPPLHRVKLPSYVKPLDNNGLESKKFSKRFKIKGWRIGEDLYLGGVKAAGDYGPGLVLDKGSYTWGFNHQGIEFQLRF
jgi:hypothetical protein